MFNISSESKSRLRAYGDEHHLWHKDYKDTQHNVGLTNL